jgi:hypothetical protein
MLKKRTKKSFLGIAISLLIMLIIQYFFISRINVNSTIQVFIDFIIFWVVLIIPFKILGVTKKSKRKTKKDKYIWRYFTVYLIIIPVLIIHYFLISKININSTIQVFIDFAIFWIILSILTQIKPIDDWMENKKK